MFGEDFTDFSRKQIHLLLGDGGRSFVVGYGNNPPLQPHHRSSSCPNKPSSCGWNEATSLGANPQTLTGALVGGPENLAGSYEDNRINFITIEVAIDYNAGFQSTLAGLAELQNEGLRF